MPSTQNLSVNNISKELFGEISDMGKDPWIRAYPDAADAGIRLVSHKTGKESIWAVDKEVKDPRENELIEWILVPTPETVRRNPELKGWTLRLAND